MLPDYISGRQEWEQLVKMQDAEEPAYRIDLRRGVSVETINRAEQYVLDSRGQRTDYNVLIMATGGREAVPRGLARAARHLHDAQPHRR